MKLKDAVKQPRVEIFLRPALDVIRAGVVLVRIPAREPMRGNGRVPSGAVNQSATQSISHQV